LIVLCWFSSEVNCLLVILYWIMCFFANMQFGL